MLNFNFVKVLPFFTFLIHLGSAIDQDVDAALVANLKVANTALDRYKLLSSASDWLFDFTIQKKYSWSPGGVINANAATFPAVTGNGMTIAILNLGPCAMLPPHIHPRATNFVTAMNGTTDTYMIQENGAAVIKETLTHGKMTIFPQASVHTMMNTGCEASQLLSALNSEDPGTTNLVNALGNLNFGMVQAAGIKDFQTPIPGIGTGSISGPEACIQRCAKQGKMIRRAETVVW